MSPQDSRYIFYTISAYVHTYVSELVPFSFKLRYYVQQRLEKMYILRYYFTEI
jgi:hypothetical protein